MRRTLRRLTFALALVAPQLSAAQPAPEVPVVKLPKPQLPRAKPVITPPASARAVAPPPASAKAAAPGAASAQAPPAGARLPSGHPAVGPPGAQPQQAAPPRDESVPDSNIPAGSIVVTLVDAKGTPRPNTGVRLGILRQTVAEGESRQFQDKRTDSEGMVTFSELKTDSAFSYRVSVTHDAAKYAAPPFNLKSGAGQRVKMHVFPVTRDINKAVVGGRGIIVTEMRDDVFQFEVMFRVFNMGRVTWVPENITFTLPDGAKGFVANETMSDARVAMADERSVELLGTYQPGQHDVTFRFQVPNDQTETANFEIGLPPHMAEIRVMAPAARDMSLSVAGFDAAQKNTGPTGQRLLVTSRQLRPGEPEMNSVSIQLSGIPILGPGRWIAVALAACFALLGLWSASRTGAGFVAPTDDLKRARRRLLDELVQLEKARAAGNIGPKTYRNTKKILMDALGRVEAENRNLKVARA